MLLAHVREALGGSIVQSIYGLRKELPVITLDPSLEQLLRDSLKSAADGSPSFEPALADRLHGALAEAAQQQEARAEPRRAARADAIAAVARALHAPQHRQSRRARVRRNSAQQIAARDRQRRWRRLPADAPARAAAR